MSVVDSSVFTEFADAEAVVVWRGVSVAGGVCVAATSWKADDTAAARWRRSNSACWAAGSLGGDGREEKDDDEERRVVVRERLKVWRGRGRRGRRNGGIVVGAILISGY